VPVSVRASGHSVVGGLATTGWGSTFAACATSMSTSSGVWRAFFTAPGGEIERSVYGWSVIHCLPT
jgi:hypothetical protein